MYAFEKNAMRIGAKSAPWLARLPSAHFVARSAIMHLTLPLPISVIVAAATETLDRDATVDSDVEIE